MLSFWFVYVLVALLAISLCWRSAWHPAIKVGSILLCLAIYLSHYLLLPKFAGWPSEAKLPENFRLLAASIEEPDKNHGRNGAIFLWTMSLDENPQPKPPRAFRLPYSVSLHEKVNAALTKIRHGLPQLGQLQHQRGQNLAVGQAAFAVHNVGLEFFDIPDPLFPGG